MSQFLDSLQRVATDSAAPEDLMVRLSDSKLTAGLDRHQALLKQWNPRINLSRVVEDEPSARKHFLESLLAGTLVAASELAIADLGSGAGFPGAPIGMLWPQLQVTLLESDVRKSVFLKEVTRGHSNLQVLAIRSDVFAKSKPKMDLVVSRAVMWADLSKLAIALNCPLVWITSEAELAKADTRKFHVERRIQLPDDAGIAIRMFHVAQ